ncbi:hypothetical protein T492DRAFT_900691 [Pavlovales sp. CCMP2436]|nr:hypothetical protein T492DRAFT_900691 [Pavlovales sp. CCMP2436]
MAGVAAETRELRLLIERAAKGDPDALSNLGYRYEKGDGAVQDQAEALRLYTQAAEQGDAVAQLRLGNCHMTGNDMPHDEKKAAKQGLALGQFSLAQCFELGAGVVQDDEEAVKLFRQAAKQGFACARWRLGDMYAQGNRSLAQNDEEAARLYRQAAEQGFAAGQYALGNSYAQGKGVPQDQPRAAKLFGQAAYQGLARAQRSFGQYCILGFGVAHNLADAARYLRLAADQGDAISQCSLGFLGEHGQGTKRDLGEAVRLYRAAAAQRDVRALARLGVCLEKGRGVVQSEAEAAASYANASKLGGAAALFDAGMNHLGITVVMVGKVSAPESFTLQLAVSDLALAARLGHVGAVKKLAAISCRRKVVSTCCMGCGATRELRLCSRSDGERVCIPAVAAAGSSIVFQRPPQARDAHPLEDPSEMGGPRSTSYGQGDLRARAPALIRRRLRGAEGQSIVLAAARQAREDAGESKYAPAGMRPEWCDDHYEQRALKLAEEAAAGEEAANALVVAAEKLEWEDRQRAEWRLRTHKYEAKRRELRASAQQASARTKLVALIAARRQERAL